MSEGRIYNYKDYMVRGSTVAKGIDACEDVQQQQIAMLIESNVIAAEGFAIAREKLYNDIQRREEENKLLKSENERIIEENHRMKRMLKGSIPMHTIKFLIFNAIVMTLSITLLCLNYGMKIYTIKPYYLICALIISITLFATACRALYDWRMMLNERG